MAVLSDLPVELITQITSEVDRAKDLPNLRCVSKRVSSVATQQLFRTIKIDDTTQGAHRLEDVLRSDLAEVVKEIVYKELIDEEEDSTPCIVYCYYQLHKLMFRCRLGPVPLEERRQKEVAVSGLYQL